LDTLRTTSIVRLTGIVLMTMPVFACSSSVELERIQEQLADLQLQTLQIQKQGATREDVQAAREDLGQRLASLGAGDADQQVSLEALAQQIEQLEAKLEDTNFRLAQLSQQITTTNQELQAFRIASEIRYANPPPMAVAEPDPTDPRALYDRAYSDFQGGSYDLSILGFRRYVEAFPGTEQTDNATYWIGESYYRQQKFQQAADQFDEVITRFPGSDRVPSALLKKGYASLELGKRGQGILQLQHVIREYPGSDEAQLARQHLEGLGIDETR
jgi:tol-pal system protein YbgF